MSEALVAKGSVDEPNVVSEIARRSHNQIPGCCWRVDKSSVVLAYKPQRFQGCQKGYEQVLSNACRLHQRRHSISAAGYVGKEVELHSGKQGLRGHEAVGDCGDLAHLLDWLCVRCLHRHWSPDLQYNSS